MQTFLAILGRIGAWLLTYPLIAAVILLVLVSTSFAWWAEHRARKAESALWQHQIQQQQANVEALTKNAQGLQKELAKSRAQAKAEQQKLLTQIQENKAQIKTLEEQGVTRRAGIQTMNLKALEAEFKKRGF